MVSNPIYDNVSHWQAYLANSQAQNNALTIGNMLKNQLMSLGSYYKGMLPEAFKKGGFLDAASKQALAPGIAGRGPGDFPDMASLIAQSKQVEGEFFQPQQGVIDAYQNKFGAGAVPGASGGVRPTSPSFAANKNLEIASGRGGNMHNVFDQLLNARLQYAGMQKQNAQQAYANAAAAEGHRANIQNSLMAGMTGMGNTAMQGMANAFRPQQVDLVYGAGGGSGGPGVNGHASSYYQNQVGPEMNTAYRKQANNLAGSHYQERNPS